MQNTSNSIIVRWECRIEKDGEALVGYLFDDNIRFWEDRGWTVTKLRGG